MKPDLRFQVSGVRGQKTEDRGLNSEDRIQKTDRLQRTDDGGRRTEYRGRKNDRVILTRSRVFTQST